MKTGRPPYAGASFSQFPQGDNEVKFSKYHRNRNAQI